MPIVLGTFTSSSIKFVDLSYYAQSCRDSMKALQPLVAKNARRSSSICCRWQTKQWTQHAVGGFHVTSSPPCWWTVNKRSLISSLCLSTSICSFHHCYLCLPRLRENHLLFSPFSSFVSQNREDAHISQWTFKSWESLCVILPEFCSKIKPQKERWNFPFILARARSRLCRK